MDASAGGESQGGAMEASGRHLDAEEGLYLPEPDRASLHDSEGLLNVHTTLVWTNYMSVTQEIWCVITKTGATLIEIEFKSHKNTKNQKNWPPIVFNFTF